MTYHYGQTVVDLFPMVPAHTYGDIVVYLPQHQILFVGDIGFFYVVPWCQNAHPSNWINVCNEIDAMDVQIVVPGHGPLGGKAELADMRDYLVRLREETRQRYDAGMSAGVAAAEIRMGKHDNWIGPERIVMDVQRFYDEFAGTLRRTSIGLAFAKRRRRTTRRGRRPHASGSSRPVKAPKKSGGMQKRFDTSLPLALSLALVLATPAMLAASPRSEAQTSSPVIDGALSPIPPAVINRDEAGRVAVRAVRVDQPLRIDGQLDEAVYTQVEAISGFIQNDPAEGEPATEKTDVWLLFDRDHVYIVARCWETRPDRMVASEMRRDNTRIVRDDNFAWSFDTFHDGRNGFIFEVSAVGGRLDGQLTNESQVNIDWNPVYDVVVGRFDGGWTMEAALPFKSLRYQGAGPQIWGFQARRVNRWKNESSYLTPLSAAQGLRGHFRASLMATLLGIDAPQATNLLEVKPYVISDVTTSANAAPPVSNKVSGELGVDVKYGVTQGLTADVTYNPDFAQVEADEQQINLTRFSLFFPEKREFFLENQGTFSFGGAATSGRQAGASDTPILFYSRSIGLTGGQEVPLRAGGRLSGRVGAFTLGALSIQADEDVTSDLRSTNFTVLRAKRDILRRSSVGAMFTGRSVSEAGSGSNETFGIDGVFGFYDDLTINSHWARTRTDGRTGNDTSYRGHLDYAGDRYGVQLEHLLVGDDFNPEVGFVRRRDMRRSFAEFRFSPRPQSIALVRRFVWTGSLAYVENLDRVLETREATAGFTVELENSDQFSVTGARTFEFLPEPFRISSDVTLPVGGYDFGFVGVGYNFGQQRRWSGDILAEHGTFFSGYKTTIGVSRGRMSLTNQFSVEPSYSVNWVDLAEGSFTTNLVGTRVTYTATPLMFTSALVQYNSSAHAVSANIRFRWEYQPGSELFIVFNEELDTEARRLPMLANRAFIVKIIGCFASDGAPRCPVMVTGHATKALFMTVWCPDSRSVESNCGIPRG